MCATCCCSRAVSSTSTADAWPRTGQTCPSRQRPVGPSISPGRARLSTSPWICWSARLPVLVMNVLLKVPACRLGRFQFAPDMCRYLRVLMTQPSLYVMNVKASRESDSRALCRATDSMASPQQGGLSMKIAIPRNRSGSSYVGAGRRPVAKPWFRRYVRLGQVRCVVPVLRGCWTQGQQACRRLRQEREGWALRGRAQVGLTKFCTGPLRRASLSLGPALRQKLITYVRLQSSSDLGIAFRQLRLAAMLLSPVRQWWVLAVAKAEGDVASP